jgi:hypothetical protein
LAVAGVSWLSSALAWIEQFVFQELVWGIAGNEGIVEAEIFLASGESRFGEGTSVAGGLVSSSRGGALQHRMDGKRASAS